MPIGPFLTNRSVAFGTPSTNNTHFPDSSFNISVDHHRPKPIFFIHPGPPKTGTTSLQSVLWEYRSLLAQDSYVYLGKSDEHADEHKFRFGPIHYGLTIKRCQRRVNSHRARNKSLHDIVCWGPLLDELQQHYELRHNLILSEEVMSLFQVPFWGNERQPLVWHVLHQTLQQWDVRIVVGYRRYYEWILSVKNQEDKYTPSHPRLLKWVDQGGMYMKPVFPQIMGMMNGTLRSYATPYPYTTQVAETYAPHFPITILNMHAEHDIITTFICEVLPSANAACQHYKRSARTKRSNPSIYTLPYDRLANAAHDKGLVALHLPRQWVVNATKFYQEVTLGLSSRDVALQCPTRTDLQPLLHKSLEYEKSILPAFYASQLGEEQLRNDFWNLVDQKRFCTVDAEETLKSPNWIDFYQSLHESYPSTVKNHS